MHKFREKNNVAFNLLTTEASVDEVNNRSKKEVTVRMGQRNAFLPQKGGDNAGLTAYSRTWTLLQ
jgi:hypothetical protein